MKKLTLASVAIAALFGVGSVAADPMYIQLPNNTYDANRFIPVGGVDANFRTANFNLFGFNDIVATSIYDYSDGSIFGTFYDTNIPAELTAAGIPANGTAIDGTTPVSLATPNCALGQCDIDGLSPLVPPLGTDNEGFLQTWDLQVLYHFDGVLTPGGPTYTGGTFEVYFNDIFNNANDRVVLRGNLVGSTINLLNLDLFFDLTYAEAGFLWVDDGTGNFRDASTAATRLHLDTNVDPPIPTANQLLPVGTNVIRQTSLDGSITASIPEPSTIALLGLSLVGFGVARRNVRK